MHIFISGIQSFWFFKSSQMFFSSFTILSIFHMEFFKASIVYNTGKLCIVSTSHSLHVVAFLQCIACTSPSWCVSQASVPPLHCPHWTLLPFPGSAKCSNRRLSCIRKLICVFVISRPLHVLILWFEDYFMHIYAFTTAKSTRNHTTKTSTTFWLTTGGVLHPQLISPININLICGIHRYI